MNLLLVTNDFPPRSGGIQQYCHNLVRRLPADRVVVYAPAWPGAAWQPDSAQPRPAAVSRIGWIAAWKTA